MSPDVLVIGGGVSGLCAAVELAARGHSVLLAEQKQHLGGRVYSFLHRESGDVVDNGQHLMLGCYHATLRYLRTVGTIDRVSLQPSLDMTFSSTAHRYRLHAPMLPAPFHVLGALLGLRSISFADRISLLRIVPALLLLKPDTDRRLQSMTVDAWLTEAGQTSDVKERLWNILSIGTLNEQPTTASAAIFVKILQTVFLGSRSDSSMAMPRAGLSALFGDGGAAYLASHGGRVMLGTRVSGLRAANGRVGSVTLGGETITPRAVVSAVPYYAIDALIGPESRPALPELDCTNGFTSVPIVSIHLWYDRHFMEEEAIALLASPVDWVFNKSFGGGAAAEQDRCMHLSLVISAARTQAAQPTEVVAAMADREVRKFFPGAHGARLVHSLVIKEKRATFSPGVGVAALRVQHTTSLENLFMAGDWTDTKLPATIEGAALSGYACAALAHDLLRTALQRQE